MANGLCPSCGAPVDIGIDLDSGERVVVESNTDSSQDAARYRVVTVGPPLMLRRVVDDAVGDFHMVHEWDCPDQNAGRTF